MHNLTYNRRIKCKKLQEKAKQIKAEKAMAKSLKYNCKHFRKVYTPKIK